MYQHKAVIAHHETAVRERKNKQMIDNDRASATLVLEKNT